MSSFFVELWESIFTPGPTPTILKATNITFAALQIVLGALLFATFSVHFVVLSVLCAGLWWSINWFATELAAAQAREEEEKKRKEKENLPTATGIAGSGDSDTEVETRPRSVNRSGGGTGKAKRPAASADVEPLEHVGQVKQRGVGGSGSSEGPSLLGTQSSVSTEDEWEKVSENENEKDKDQ
ncbi:V-type ATPase assembly factor pkr1 [Cladobotryum mycophilum]|uniref:V-type ATPase assembly factor pkr1 n=1 Tax=Cladobotryum mycophilum TaxID=491253 RepID=A0ABR0SFC8_9HYPO